MREFWTEDIPGVESLPRRNFDRTTVEVDSIARVKCSGLYDVCRSAFSTFLRAVDHRYIN